MVPETTTPDSPTASEIREPKISRLSTDLVPGYEVDRARTLLEATTIGAQVEASRSGLVITLPAGAPRDVIPEVARVLIEAMRGG